MKLPGFAAEAALHPRIGHHKAARRFRPGPGFMAPAADCPLGICNKKKSSARCKPNAQGFWVCEGGHAGETCYEEWYSDGSCNPTSYAACSGNRRYPLCK